MSCIWLDVSDEFVEALPFPWFEWSYPVPGPNPSLPLHLKVWSDEGGCSVQLCDPFGTPVGSPLGWLWSDLSGDEVESIRAQRRSQ